MTDDPMLRRLLSAFLAENAKLNLSAHRTEDQCWTKNILDSLAVLSAPIVAAALPSLRCIVDIGTGGGFPLLPLALALPNVQCIGIDSVKKKVDAVRRIVEAMQINNVELLAIRAEAAGKDPALRRVAGMVTARAVAKLPVLLAYAAPLLAPGGIAAFFKGPDVESERAASDKAAQSAGLRYEGEYRYELPHGSGKRTIVMFRNIHA